MMKLHQMAPAPFCLFFLIKICSFLLYPSLQIPPVKKKTQTNKKTQEINEWQKRRRANSLRGAGPIKRGPRSLRRMRPEREEDERSSPHFLKIDFLSAPRGRLTGRQVGVFFLGLKEEGRLFSNTKADERSLLAGWTVWRCTSRHRANTNSVKLSLVERRKYFRYIMPSCPFQSTWLRDLRIMWLTVAALRCDPINEGPKFKQMNDIRLYLCCATRAFFSLPFSLSNFLQDLEKGLASLHSAL